MSPETRRFVDVPIRVVIPPRIAANESGIRSFDTGIPVFMLHTCSLGISMATIGVLFRKADIAAVLNIRRLNTRPR
jgi:hypothetical protein